MAKCPKCGKKPVLEFKPFCSKRCQDADLAAWITEKYRVASADEERDSADAQGDDEESNIH